MLFKKIISITPILLFLCSCGAESYSEYFVPRRDAKSGGKMNGMVLGHGSAENPKILIYALSSNSPDKPWRETSVEADGTWEADLDVGYGDFRIVYQADDEEFETYVFGLNPGDLIENIKVTPITTLALEYADWLNLSDEISLQEAWEKSSNIFESHFGVLLNSKNKSNIFEEEFYKCLRELEVLYSLRTVNKYSITFQKILLKLRFDIGTDGIFDGAASDSDIFIDGFKLSSEVLSSDLKHLMEGKGFEFKYIKKIGDANSDLFFPQYSTKFRLNGCDDYNPKFFVSDAHGRFVNFTKTLLAADGNVWRAKDPLKEREFLYKLDSYINDYFEPKNVLGVYFDDLLVQSSFPSLDIHAQVNDTNKCLTDVSYQIVSDLDESKENAYIKCESTSRCNVVFNSSSLKLDKKHYESIREFKISIKYKNYRGEVGEKTFRFKVFIQSPPLSVHSCNFTGNIKELEDGKKLSIASFTLGSDTNKEEAEKIKYAIYLASKTLNFTSEPLFEEIKFYEKEPRFHGQNLETHPHMDRIRNICNLKAGEWFKDFNMLKNFDEFQKTKNIHLILQSHYSEYPISKETRCPHKLFPESRYLTNDDLKARGIEYMRALIVGKTSICSDTSSCGEKVIVNSAKDSSYSMRIDNPIEYFDLPETDLRGENIFLYKGKPRLENSLNDTTTIKEPMRYPWVHGLGQKGFDFGWLGALGFETKVRMKSTSAQVDFPKLNIQSLHPGINKPEVLYDESCSKPLIWKRWEELD